MRDDLSPSTMAAFGIAFLFSAASCLQRALANKTTIISTQKGMMGH